VADPQRSRGCSYLRRRGRATKAQCRALADASAMLLQPTETVVDWNAQFRRAAPLALEIGFGMGQALIAWAHAVPSWNFVGIDVYQPGIGAALLAARSAELENLRLIDDDANHALQVAFAPASLSEVRIYFPDPWPKQRHHKRRLIQPGFVEVLASRLVDGGELLLATDWQPYAEWMLECLEAETQLTSLNAGGFAPRSEARPVTRFEARGHELGHAVWDLAYRKCATGSRG